MTNSTATAEKTNELIDDPLGDIERTGNCDHCKDTGTTDSGQPCFICLEVTHSSSQSAQATAPVTDGGQETFDADAETVTDDWEDTFLSTSWGYDQTNVELAQITDVSKRGRRFSRAG